MEYGYFDNKNSEYVITRADTPTPWINYLGQDDYCAIVSNTGGGYSFHKDPRDRRILRYRYNNIPHDRSGRYLYLRDHKSKEYWPLGGQPTIQDLTGSKYECRQGLGYTQINLSYQEITSELTYFVPLKENLEVWLLKLKNVSSKSRQLSLFSYVEFCLWQAVMDMQDFQYSLNIARADCREDTIYHLTNYYPKVGCKTFAYFASSEKISGFDTDREIFIGNYRDESRPIAVEKGKCSNSLLQGGNPIGSHQIKLNLKAQEEKYIVFVLGIDEDKSNAQKKIRQYKNPKLALKKLQELKNNWRVNLNKFSTKTPDKEFDTMINVWNQYQCRTTFNWSRSASLYESGIGRGIGFRDSNQDTLGALHAIPKRVRQRIIDLAKNQFKAGDAYHQYFPLTKKGDKAGYSDDHLWLIVSTVNYIKETGDFDFLKKQVTYADGGAGSIYEHLLKAVDYSMKNRGRNGMPYLGYADWNDCLNNLGKRAESVWVGQLLCFVINELLDLTKVLKKIKDYDKLNKLYIKMSELINRNAWDGAWYKRAFDNYGKVIGSNKCKEGKIYLNSQSWAILSGIADKKRARLCMNSVKSKLDTKHGIILIDPAYQTFNPNIGAIGTFAPGLKENAGIFCHANPWAMIAETKLGRGDQAFNYYKKTAPIERSKIADIHYTEPYIYSQFIAGRESQHPGRARNSWLTGAASWNYIAATWYILGIRPDYRGLVVDPCIPRNWKSFKVHRVFRGTTYDIQINNPKRVSKGVKSIRVDGQKIEGNILPIFKDRKHHTVKVVMG